MASLSPLRSTADWAWLHNEPNWFRPQAGVLLLSGIVRCLPWCWGQQPAARPAFAVRSFDKGGKFSVTNFRFLATRKLVSTISDQCCSWHLLIHLPSTYYVAIISVFEDIGCLEQYFPWRPFWLRVCNADAISLLPWLSTKTAKSFCIEKELTF